MRAVFLFVGLKRGENSVIMNSIYLLCLLVFEKKSLAIQKKLRAGESNEQTEYSDHKS